MKDFFNSSLWNTLALVIMGFVAVITREIVTFVMLGIVLIMLSNVYDKLAEISRKMDRD